MKIVNLFFVAAILLSVAACSSSTNLTKTVQDAEIAYSSGDYQKALEYYETVIASYQNQGNPNECPVYFQAASAALQLGMPEKALGYLEQNRYTTQVNGETYYELSKLYREQDNLSKELDALETYIAEYPKGDETAAVHRRLFEIYIEIEDYEKALEEWDQLSANTQQEESWLEDYFLTNKALNNDSVCDRLAEDLLTLNEENVLALDWTAKKYFWQAEDRYQSELKAYEKNKTNKQYNQLLRALDVVSADYKTALGYFKKLYALDPSPKTAKYLGNIYNRLDDKQKADYYYELAE
jgi:tetratricopeptide (TPR) repeat protein